jgi:hypothetical protein
MPQDMLYEHSDSVKRNAGEIRTKVVERSALGLAIPGTNIHRTILDAVETIEVTGHA